MGHKKTQQNGKSGGGFELQFDEDRLKIYYNKIFPFTHMFKWISYNKLN